MTDRKPVRVRADELYREYAAQDREYMWDSYDINRRVVQQLIDEGYHYVRLPVRAYVAYQKDLLHGEWFDGRVADEHYYSFIRNFVFTNVDDAILFKLSML